MIKSQIPLRFWLLALICNLSIGNCSSFAQDEDRAAALTKQIAEAKTTDGLYELFAQLRDIYFAGSRYREFVDFLKSLKKDKAIEPFVNYDIALTRYRQLKFLEEGQIWDEYFDQGNNYREEIVLAAQKAIDATSPKFLLNIYARLLLWQFHEDLQDVLAGQALSDLIDAVLNYSEDTADPEPIKEVADMLFAYAQKNKAKQLYQLYVEKITAVEKDNKKLAGIALGFYNAGNLELAEAVYNIYISEVIQLTPKEEAAGILAAVAQTFAYKKEGKSDMFYAEKAFKKMEEIAGIEAFDQELIYLRALNLEKSKEFPKARDYYAELISRYPKSPHTDEAYYKAGIISVYLLRDLNLGREYFTKLTQEEKDITPQMISSLYQLGLLSQWQEDFENAGKYYEKLLESAGRVSSDTLDLAKQRMEEIQGQKPIEYNLKNFLDASLKAENVNFDMTKITIKSSPYKPQKGEYVNISSDVFSAPQGCLQLELQYLWSGHIGKPNTPSIEEGSFDTIYENSGTKEINLVVISPAGIIDRSLDLSDVQ